MFDFKCCSKTELADDPDKLKRTVLMANFGKDTRYGMKTD
jgi:hypothetical protein